MSRIMWGVETDPVTIIRQKLIELNQPSAEDLRRLSEYRAKTKPSRKLAHPNANINRKDK